MFQKFVSKGKKYMMSQNMKKKFLENYKLFKTAFYSLMGFTI